MARHPGAGRRGERGGRPVAGAGDGVRAGVRRRARRLNQRLAAESEEAALVVAGRVMDLP
ncbi:bifunctional adenosylcobinamide kinase/adenosylcobinamide-phosphate guanylyltransferase [Actinomadura madurae]|uniref:bifunctional adenosylcobinamide kinase/adenosylcobinamide-phosphate guanylyltransferase n=1 Tax=Actinomadura madurae TaxID=1993 RepID=UPI0020D2133B|nr:bifunctional adenosylcobinamide kinase/adenosylcobinamide-phosphate guanylyltransferase [Actinomadura madurae]MCP9984022.1 bifunctional adenosylcobinamide kinase/adenosylcobinamide-phosphate guanylyltransferase [Actinomadura madurae]